MFKWYHSFCKNEKGEYKKKGYVIIRKSEIIKYDNLGNLTSKISLNTQKRERGRSGENKA